MILLKKELIFDRLTITDFELNKQTDGTVKYIPICPKCGKVIEEVKLDGTDGNSIENQLFTRRPLALIVNT